jgi:surface antigen
MLDTRAILLAAAAVVGFAGEARALTPLSADLAIDPSISEGPSSHSVLAPRAFERAPDEAYEPTARVANSRSRLQCVPFARQESGVEIYGNANTWWTQARGRYETSEAPVEGGVLVLRGYSTDNRGHVAVVKEVVSPRLIIVDHANWLNAGEITRDVPVRDVSAAGDWSEVQVWHVPGRHWGARRYNVQGFILNIVAEARAQAAAASPVG